jgi:putative hemolysin
MTAGSLALIAVGLLLLMAASALFSAIETALFSLQPHHVERLRKRRASLGNAVSRLMENPRRLLSALLLGDAMVNLPLIVIGLYFLHTMPSMPMPWWASALILFSLIVFVCDLIPKLLALSQTYRLAKVGVAVMSVLMPVFDPIARVLQRVSKWLADLLTPKSIEPIPFLSEDELETPRAAQRGRGRPARDRERDDPGDHQAGRQDRERLHDTSARHLCCAGRPDERGTHPPLA